MGTEGDRQGWGRGNRDGDIVKSLRSFTIINLDMHECDIRRCWALVRETDMDSTIILIWNTQIPQNLNPQFSYWVYPTNYEHL